MCFGVQILALQTFDIDGLDVAKATSPKAEIGKVDIEGADSLSNRVMQGLKKIDFMSQALRKNLDRLP